MTVKMPEPIENAVRGMVDKVRKAWEKGEMKGSTIVLANTETGDVSINPVDTENEATKNICAMGARFMAEHIGADVAIFINDAWILNERARDEWDKVKAQYNYNMGNHPDRIDCIQVMVETQVGHWSAVAECKPRGKKGRTFGELEFELLMGARGRFVGLLPKPKGPVN